MTITLCKTKLPRSVSDVNNFEQKLRRLVREVHSIQERQVTVEENEGSEEAALIGATRSLTCFLQTLAKQLPSE